MTMLKVPKAAKKLKVDEDQGLKSSGLGFSVLRSRFCSLNANPQNHT